MPAFQRSGGEWIESVPHARSGNAWTDEDDQLFARDGGEWKLIYPDDQTGALLPVVNLRVTSGPTHNSVTIGWTNPTQPSITPTDVQIRLATLGSVWTEQSYPLTSWSWGALDASKEYVAQVRLIERVDGVITNTSPTRSVSFTTATAPVGAPAPDPGGTGGDTIFPIGTTTGGTPSPPSTSNGCWWEWKLMIMSTTALQWLETGITGTANGDADNITYDAAGLDATRVYRLCIREACDTTGDGNADTFGEWTCGDSFPGFNDWGANCAGVSDSAYASRPALADVVFRYPKFCKNADSNQIVMVEAVTGTEVGKGPAFGGHFTIDGEQGVLPDPATVGGTLFPQTMVAPLSNLPSVIAVGQDSTIVTRFRALSAFSGSPGRSVRIAAYGGLLLSFRLVESATGWTPSVQALTNAGTLTLTGNEIPYDTDLHTVALRWDVDGNKDLLVDGTIVDSDTSGTSDWYETATLTGGLTAAPANLLNMQQAGWDRLLTDLELINYINALDFDTEATESGPPADETNVTVSNGSLVVVGSHLRSTGGGSVTALPPTSMTNVGSFSTLQASTVYDSGGVSNGAVALFAGTATAAGTAQQFLPNEHQMSVVSLPAGATIAQSSQTVGAVDAVSASLGSVPTNRVYVMLFTGGQQTTVTPPAAPAGWEELVWEEKNSSSGYLVRAAIYKGASQTFAVTLPTGATAGGGWGVQMFELGA